MPELSEDDAVSEREELLRDFRIYDASVDVTSAFEALFTLQGSFAPRVVHFERYPSITKPDGVGTLTPDFTVVFEDGLGVIFEIAQLGLHPHSADSLCSQIGQYAELTELPGPNGTLLEVTEVDVLTILPVDLLNNAVDAIIGERMDQEGHPYKPPKPPVIVGYSRTPDYYAFIVSRDPRNGRPSDDLLASFLERFAAKVGFWGHVKIQRRFANDPVKPLYLATLLWATVLPDMMGNAASLDFSDRDVDATLKAQYGVVRLSEVRAALELLVRARLVSIDAGTQGYSVRRRALTREERGDVHAMIAERATTRLVTAPARRPGPSRNPKRSIEGQMRMFGEDDLPSA